MALEWTNKTNGVDNVDANDVNTLAKAITEDETDLATHKSAVVLQHPDKSVTTAKIADSAVTTDKINDKAVTKDKINEGAVITAKIADKAITTDKLNDTSVTTGKIAGSAVTSAKIAEKNITTYHIADNAIITDKLADNSVTETKLDTALSGKINSKANSGDVYTKTEIDTKLDTKANKATTLSGYGILNAYTKAQVDTALEEKADVEDVYSKTQADIKLAQKANADDVYTKTQTDTKLADKEDTANKVTEISDTSTNEQYPSAKAVNDIVKVAKTAANSTFANALKGSASGENAVRIDDSSPAEHEMSVKVSSKNLIPYPYADTTKAVNGITFTDNGNGTITASGTAAETAIFAPYTISNYFCLEAGTYTYSDSISNPSTDTYYSEIRTVDDDSIVVHSYDSNKTFTVTETTKFRINLIIAGEQTVDLTFKPQVECGTTDTEYTPYISDLTSVTLTQRGKNLLPYVYTDGNITRNGITYTRNADGTVTISGTSAGSQYFISNRELKLPKRIKVTYQAFSDGSDSTYNAIFSNYNGTTYVPWLRQTNKPVTVSIPSNRISNLYKFEVLTGTTLSDKKAYPIVELGDTYTGYEPVLPEVNYTPSADGTVTGVKNIYPTTTLLSDTDGVIIDVEYNRDINKAFEELQNAILSQGGNV